MCHEYMTSVNLNIGTKNLLVMDLDELKQNDRLSLFVHTAL